MREMRKDLFIQLKTQQRQRPIHFFFLLLFYLFFVVGKTPTRLRPHRLHTPIGFHRRWRRGGWTARRRQAVAVVTFFFVSVIGLKKKSDLGPPHGWPGGREQASRGFGFWFLVLAGARRALATGTTHPPPPRTPLSVAVPLSPRAYKAAALKGPAFCCFLSLKLLLAGFSCCRAAPARGARAACHAFHSRGYSLTH